MRFVVTYDTKTQHNITDFYNELREAYIAYEQLLARFDEVIKAGIYLIGNELPLAYFDRSQPVSGIVYDIRS